MGVEWVAGVAAVARQLRELGLGAMAEEAYLGAIHQHLQSKLLRAARGRYEAPVSPAFHRWIEAVPLRFLSLLLPPSAPPTPPSMYHSPAASPFPSPLACPSTPVSVAGGHPRAGVLAQWKQRLEGLAYEILGDLRTTELFDIIVDYPESLPAVEDLRECLAHARRQHALVDAFRTQLRQRLLLPGAATTDILTHYIATIKSLRVLDPSGVVLGAVGGPIQEYLRGRKDTIRGIVTLLTDDTAASTGGESLYEELSKTAAAETDDWEDDDARAGDSEEDAAAAQAWEPDPVAAEGGDGGRQRRGLDLISALVGMYGSKEVFVNEYRVMLADRLLAKTDYNIATDVRTLELLKLRFADANLQQCDAMLKDLADSKRINTLIHTQPPRPSSPPQDPATHAPPGAGAARRLPPGPGRGAGRGQPQLPPGAAMAASPAPAPGEFVAGRGAGSSSENEARLQAIRARMRALRQGPVGAPPAEGDPTLDSVDATIVSALFWPPFQADTVHLPGPVQSVLDAYSARYQELKAPRKLAWNTGLGTVRLELDHGGRTVQYAVSPIHAAIIWHFQDRTRWPAQELANAVGAKLGALRKKAVFWVNQGVLAESAGLDGTGVYRLVEAGEKGAGGSARGPGEEEGVTVVVEEEGESAVTSAEDQMESGMQIYKDYVVGMLTNLDALPLERIHNMLKMFVVDPPFDKTAQQLQTFLNNLIREEVLEFRDNLYRVVRKPNTG